MPIKMFKIKNPQFLPGRETSHAPLVVSQEKPRAYILPDDAALEGPGFLMLPTEIQLEITRIILTTSPLFTVEALLQAVPEIHHLMSVVTDYTANTPSQIRIPWYFRNKTNILADYYEDSLVSPIKVFCMSNFYEAYTRSPALALRLYSRHLTRGAIVYLQSFGLSVFGERDLNRLLKSTGVSFVTRLSDTRAVRGLKRDLDFASNEDFLAPSLSFSPAIPEWCEFPEMYRELRCPDVPLWNLSKVISNECPFDSSQIVQTTISLYNYDQFRHGCFRSISHVRWKTESCPHICHPAVLILNGAVNLKSLYVEYHGGKIPILSCDTDVAADADSFTIVNTSWSPKDHNGSLCEHAMASGAEDQSSWTIDPFKCALLVWCRPFRHFTFAGVPDSLLDLVDFNTAESIHWKRLTPSVNSRQQRMNWSSTLYSTRLRTLTIEAFLQDYTNNPIPMFHVPQLRSLVLKQIEGSTGSFWNLEGLIFKFPAFTLGADEYGLAVYENQELIYPTELRELYFIGTETLFGDYLTFDIASPAIFKNSLTKLVISGYLPCLTSERSGGLEYPLLQSLTLDISQLMLTADSASIHPVTILDFGQCSFRSLVLVQLDVGFQPEVSSPVIAAQASIRLVNLPKSCGELLISQMFQRNSITVNGSNLTVGEGMLREETRAGPEVFRIWKKSVYAPGGPEAQVFQCCGTREVDNDTPM